jgi:Ca2+:H+ antiporter
MGGLRHKNQRFNNISSQVNSSMLMLSSLGMLLPTILVSNDEVSDDGVLVLSRVTSVILLVVSCLFLYFQVNYAPL